MITGQCPALSYGAAARKKRSHSSHPNFGIKRQSVTERNYDDDDDSYSIRHWTDVPPAGEVCFVPLFIAGST